MKNRKQPFGYEIRFGQVEINTTEAATVRLIFQRYLAGASYATLVRELANCGVAYDAGRQWNKNMVARILADSRYTGEGEYAALIDKDRFQAAAKLRPGKAAESKRSPLVKELQRLAVCAACGKKAVRCPNQHGRERWSCPNCAAISTAATDHSLSDNTAAALQRLIATPELIQQPKPIPPPPNAELRELENSFQAALADPLRDEEAAKKLIFAIAAAAYNELGNEGYETHRLQRLFADPHTKETPMETLLPQAASAVLLHSNGEVSLKLKNGQITERSYQP